MSKVILSLGLGDLDNGFFRVTVQLWTGNQRALMQCQGSLPPAPSLAVLHRNWQSLYRGYYQNMAVRLDIDTTDSEDTDRFSDAEFWETCQKLPQQLNDWLNSDSFRGIEQQLRKHLHHCEEIQLIVETEDTDARKLPWHLWNFLDDYPASEVALSLPEFEGKVAYSRTPPGEVRILGILGNSTNIDITKDKAIIEKLPGAKPEFLSQPERHQLQAKLWEQDWDIVFFAGHSCSSGKIYINTLDQENTLTVEELENALRHQINRGLKLAIFNSCESLELAIGLGRLNLSLTIAMREPVPDKVAAVFLKYFLQAFA
ncbi:MAG: CHAT domain-containing protein, partial [Prochloron sp. SP5CPC1]|nr:CHAT domain-containing protein [Candidatus Paraprochloron terpiosi SP5CPC1]